MTKFTSEIDKDIIYLGEYMSFFQKRPFSKSLYLRSNLQWVKQQIFKSKSSKSLRTKLLDSLAKSGYKREFINIDELHSLDPNVFMQEYYKKNRPVIFKNVAKNWPCMNWTLDHFAENFGEFDTINTNVGHMEILSLAETISLIRNNNSHKARICNLLTHSNELLKQSNLHKLSELLPRISFKTSHQFFIGTKGNFTPLHAGGTNNYQIQVSGEKVWHLIDPIFNPVVHPVVDGEPLFKSLLNTDNPDFERFPEMKYIPILRAHLEPGDILFNPTFYWHQVKYLNESIAVGLRSLSPYSVLKSSKTMLAVMSTATNPPALVSLLKIKKGETAPFFK